MLAQEIQLLAAIVLDSLIGDPRWWPHPVRLIGVAALALEHRARMIRQERTSSGSVDSGDHPGGVGSDNVRVSMCSILVCLVVGRRCFNIYHVHWNRGP